MVRATALDRKPNLGLYIIVTNGRGHREEQGVDGGGSTAGLTCA